MGKVDINVLFSILGMLTTSLVDNDLADERSQDLGCELLDVRVLADYFKEAFHIGGRCLEVFYCFSQLRDLFLNRSLFLVVPPGQHAELLTGDLPEDMILIEPFKQSI